MGNSVDSPCEQLGTGVSDGKIPLCLFFGGSSSTVTTRFLESESLLTNDVILDMLIMAPSGKIVDLFREEETYVPSLTTVFSSCAFFGLLSIVCGLA